MFNEKKPAKYKRIQTAPKRVVKPQNQTQNKILSKPDKNKHNKIVDKPANKVVKETFPHFRRYKKNNHPALIIGEHSPKEYKFRKAMHSERDGRHLNEKVYPNPNPNDPKPMYISKRIKHDEKRNFNKRLPWTYPKKDKKK